MTCEQGVETNCSKHTTSLIDLQMGEVSLRVVHLDKVALGPGHYYSPTKTVINVKRHRQLENSEPPVV